MPKDDRVAPPTQALTLWTFTEGRAPSEAPSDGPSAGPGERYHDLGLIGAGGMGEVRRVRDRELNRVVAMKLLHGPGASHASSLARFVEEVQTTAQLQHPGIVPVYDAGRLADGRLYFTMKEVQGHTFGEVIREVHAASGERWERAASGWTFRRLVSALHQASLAVAFAHERGVVHRDLKPANVMVGAYGEVQVMDWGLCKIVGKTELPLEATDAVVVERSRDATHVGQVMGTPAYLSPEQALGEPVDGRTDVYALGAMLYEVLAGREPYSGPDGISIVCQVLAGPPPPPSRERAVSVDLPEDLVDACLVAMAREPDRRYPTAGAFAAALEAWLEGSKRRAQALDVVAKAEAAVPEAEALRARAAALRAEARAELAALASWAPEAEKLAAWAKQDEAAALERQASLKSLERDQLLAGALTHVPDLSEAHAALAEDQRARHEAAEADRDTAAVARAEALLRAHAEALPERHPVRQRCATYLRGSGALTLVTDHDAEVELLRYEPHGRRLVARPLRSLGRTPLVEVPLEMGSYLCVLRRPGRAAVRYPVHIARGAHWDGVRPGDRDPHPIDLPPADALGPDDCYVPAGWFQAGDTFDAGALAPGRLWCDAFVVRRFPVTNTEYIAFLDDLVAQGRDEEALRFAPRESAGQRAHEGALIYGRDDEGRFRLVADAEGDVWLGDWPVIMIDWSCATAYARWLAARTSAPWRLPWDLEWEKAARGVDGRCMPWGDGFDPSFCCMRDSHPGRQLPASVGAYPIDESVYGVRGLGGNVQDWCVDVWSKSGPPLTSRIVAPLEASGDFLRAQRVRHGGRWGGHAGDVRAPPRYSSDPGARAATLGFRVAKSWSVLG